METSVKHHYNRMYHHLLFFTLVLHLGHIHPAMASDLSLGGHLKTQTSHSDFDSNNLIDQLGPERPTTQTLDLRTNSAVSHGSLELVAQAEFLALISDNLAARKDLARQLGELQPDRLLPTDNRRLFDFSKEIVDANKVQAVARLDRLYLVHSDESTVLKAGRQAISWGNGLVFHTFDLFNPFSPVEIDRDYKPGDDMLYAQQLFANGADLQLLAVVRRDTLTNNVKDSASSYASKFHARLEEIDLDYELLVARHYEDHLAGFGLSLSLIHI